MRACNCGFVWKHHPDCNYEVDLARSLREKPGYVGRYLTAAAADSPEAFLVGLRDVVRSRGGMAKVARAAKVNREGMYRTLSGTSNPGVRTIMAILGALDLRIDVVEGANGAREEES